MSLPIDFRQVLEARDRIRPYLEETPLRCYEPLDSAVGREITVWVKHENHNPTNAFKVRNALSVLTALSSRERRGGVVAASRGNHGLGLAWAGRRLSIPVTVCVPVGNNPEKIEAIRGLGAEVVEEGRDYDEAIETAERLCRERGARLVHSTNDPRVIAGAATITLEILERAERIDAMILAVGGGSQAVGAIVVARELSPSTTIHAVQAAKASTIHDSWHARRPLEGTSTDTFADGLATRSTYETTFEALLSGLAGFVTVSEREIASALEMFLRTTHNLAEGAGAAGLAGLMKMRDELAGKSVAVVLSGSNIDRETLRDVLTGRIA